MSPGNSATLSIGGDLNIEQTKVWVAKYFATIPKGTKPIPRPNIVEPAQTEEKRVTYLDKAQLPAVVFALSLTHRTTPSLCVGNGGQNIIRS
ncbi:MAG: insulinase family protein [Bacteroidetes bacterium]|nr:insulinase family protein [Bacteroidota bacterium]